VEHLLPLLVVIPLGAAFLIPMANLIGGRRGTRASEVIALLAAAALVAVSLATFAYGPAPAVWIGGYRGASELLGVTGGAASAELPGPAGAPVRGVVVEQVVAQSAAAAAGLRAGDIITAWAARKPDQEPAAERESQPLHSMNELRRENAALEPGGQLVLQVVREGKAMQLVVTAGKSVTGIAMFSDGLTRLLVVMISVVSFAAVLFSLSYMRPYTKVYLYYCPLMLMIAGMNGVVVSGDLFNIYVFVEVAAIASYALVGFGVEAEELEASFKYLVLSAVASGFILLGIGIVYSLRGTLNLAQIADFTRFAAPNDALWLAVGFFIAGFGLKAAMVPFHAWLPDAHPSAPAPVSAMLSGLLIKATGVYVIARLVFNVLGVSTAVAYVLMTMGVLSMVVGVFLAVGQWDFKRLLAYHSISQMGYVILALGVGAEVLARREAVTENWSALAFLAIFAGLFHLINHAAFKSLLFLSSGSVVYRTGTRDLKELGGMGRKMPWTSFFARIGALSISGMPPFNGFFSKLMIVIAVVWAGHWLLGAVTVLVSFVTLLSFIKVQRYLIDGEVPARFADIKESPLPMQLAMGILAAACVLLGVLVPLHMGTLIAPAAQALFGQIQGYAAAVFGG
jgi:multicomponent Na+:H+ antiporter subunit D